MPRAGCGTHEWMDAEHAPETWDPAFAGVTGLNLPSLKKGGEGEFRHRATFGPIVICYESA